MVCAARLLMVSVGCLMFIDYSYQQCVEEEYNLICTHINQTNIGTLLDDGYYRIYVRYANYGGSYRVPELWIRDSEIQILPSNISRSYIQKVTLEGIYITRIIPGTFKRDESNFEELYLRNNQLKRISNGVFTTPFLKILDLQQNKLEEIEEHAFVELRSLRKILLNCNNLSKISNIFDSMVLLEYLDLSHNFIKSLDKSVFLSNLDLKYIYINNNNISSISEDIFIYNKNLTTLDLSYNPIKHINFVTFTNLPNLENLNISFTEKQDVVYFDKALLNGVAKIAKVSLDGNNISEFSGATNTSITSMSLSENHLDRINNTMFEGCIYLVYLNVSKNNIDDIDKKAFLDLTSLQVLDLSVNKIQVLPHGLFSNLQDLQSLDLSSNLIQVLPYGVFDALQNLTFLDISSNEISSIVPYTLHSLRKLTGFRLDNNNIEYLDGIEITSQLISLKAISFDNNLWSCSKLIKLVHILENKSVKVNYGNTSDSHNVNKIKCDDVISIDDYKSNYSSPVVYTDIKDQISKGFSSFNSKFYSSSFYEFFNGGFEETKFYKFFKNAEYKALTFPSVGGDNTSSTVDKSVAYKLVDSEHPEPTYARLEFILYLLCTVILLNFSLCVYIVYKFFGKRGFKQNSFLNDPILTNETELV